MMVLICFSSCRLLLVLFLALSFLACPSQSTVHDSFADGKKRKKPNILLLLTDDQDVLLGGADHMPNLDKLVKQAGTTFANAFVHTPICCPSRSSILSGRYLHNGVAKNNSVSGNCNGQEWQDGAEWRTFAMHAHSQGYHTAYSGKYLNQYGFNHSTRVPPGWDRWFGLVGNSVYYNYNIVEYNATNSTQKKPLVRHHGRSYARDYLPDLVANQTLKVLEEFLAPPRTHPFLVVAAWPSCHAPFTPAPWAKQDHHFDFNSSRARQTPNWNASYESIQEKHWFVRQMAPIGPTDEASIAQMHEKRLQTLLSVDQHIQQFINLLKRYDALEDTIIIYTSDNGFQLGQHRITGDKRQLYEHDIRVPFFVRGPGFGRNVTSLDIVMNIDIAPTIYQATSSGGDISLPFDMDGISFLPRQSNDHVQKRYDFLVSYHGEGFPPCQLWTCPPPAEFHGGDATNNTYHCVRTIDHVTHEDSMYCEFVDEEHFVEFYDLNQDEWQLENIYQSLDAFSKQYYAARLAELKSCSGASCREAGGQNRPREHVISSSSSRSSNSYL